MILSFTQAILRATMSALLDSKVHVFGLGAEYPNGLDGTMGDLSKMFQGRVHDTPCSEAAVTGMAVGMAAMGLRPLVHHGRIEFALYGMDALLTQAAKWSAMFGGGYPVPLTVRIAMGRQWGNGPQHTINAKGLFAMHGLKVVCPSTPQMAHDLLIAAVKDDNPVIYLEPRWLYKMRGTVGDICATDLGKARIVRQGTDITVVAVGDMVLETLKAAKLVEHIVSVEVVDLVSVYPIDEETILQSVEKTRSLLVCESSQYPYSTASQVIASVGMECVYISMNALTCPDYPCPTAPSLTRDYYPTRTTIANEILSMFGKLHRFTRNETFEELNLPPTDNVDEFLTDSGLKVQVGGGDG